MGVMSREIVEKLKNEKFSIGFVFGEVGFEHQ